MEINQAKKQSFFHLQENVSSLDSLMKNETSEVFFDFTREGTLEHDEDNKEMINLKRKLKTTRELFQFAKDSGNEERALKRRN